MASLERKEKDKIRKRLKRAQLKAAREAQEGEVAPEAQEAYDVDDISPDSQQGEAADVEMNDAWVYVNEPTLPQDGATAHYIDELLMQVEMRIGYLHMTIEMGVLMMCLSHIMMTLLMKTWRMLG